MSNDLYQNVLKKVERGLIITEEEEEIVFELEQKGLVKISEGSIMLTPRGEVIMVLGFDSVKRTEEMDMNHYASTKVPDKVKTTLFILFSVVMFTIFLILWLYFEEILNF